MRGGMDYLPASAHPAIDMFYRLFGEHGIKGFPNELAEKIAEEEGYRRHMYMDPLRNKRYPKGRETYGFGSLATPEDVRKWPVGTDVPEDVIRERFREDALEYYRKAKEDAADLASVGDDDFTNALFSVNYQSGPRWSDIHKRTWKYLSEAADGQPGRWEDAAREVQDSDWFEQTPNRVRNFQRAILRRSGLSDKEIEKFMRSLPVTRKAGGGLIMDSMDRRLF